MSRVDEQKVQKTIEKIVVKARRKKSFELLYLFVLLLVALSSFCQMLSLGTFINIVVVLTAGLILLRLKLNEYRAITASNMVEHLSRQFPVLEESLFLINQKNRSLLAEIQCQKVIQQFLLIDNEQLLSRVIPKAKVKTISLMAMLIISVSALGWFLKGQYFNVESQALTAEEKVVTASEVVTLNQVRVLVSPPGYTQKESMIYERMNLQVPEGAIIQWELEFSHPEYQYYWIGSDGEAQPITKNNNDKWSVKNKVNQTGFYRLAYQEESALKNLPEVYTIEVDRDRSPKIKIVEPGQSLVEFAKNDNTAFSIQALIKDDYGIEKVDILASVAKGSGEAVKFRDKTFQFTHVTEQEQGALYQKNWTLVELGMEPGDEVYFHIKAKDNKQPEGQWSKSTSLIVRWLDDEVIETAAEGIQIRFIPEFFRSQRQIIIETEQLIADKNELSQAEIDEISRDLGHSQNNLKQKYGQYLGDEFGEGSEALHGLADGYHGGEDVAHGEADAGMGSHDDEHEQDEDEHHEEAAERPEVGHLHEDMVDKSDRSGASELIARFAHNHGTVEVGPLSKMDPKSWMKKAVNQMWQAELHLMLSEPEKALPFEYKAYDYLKLARQAERIYVKRLGFEPPPVKEERRLSGELDKILTYSLTVVDEKPKDDHAAIIQNAFSILGHKNSDSLEKESDLAALKKLSELLLSLSESRPALIQHAATVEKIIATNRVQLLNCDQCLQKLKQKLWQLMSLPASQPSVFTPLFNIRQSGGIEDPHQRTPVNTAGFAEGESK